MSNSINYIPKPSRVQSPCIFATNTPYTDAFIPEKTENLPPAEAILRNKELYKAAVLKNTNNTFRITKNQKYSQIAKCLGPSRTKTFGTQSQTYSNPNTTNLTRVGYTVADYDNQIVGKPNNFAGPFQFNIPNPFGCSTTGIEEGGNLLCDVYGNPCSGAMAQDNKPQAPTLLSADAGCGLITLIWDYTNTLAITNFNIYQRTNNGNTTLIISLSNMVRTYVVNNLLYYNTYSFFITALNNTTESVPSNTISTTPTQIGPPVGFTGTPDYTSNGCPIIKLSWQPPNPNNNCLATLTSYNIYDSNSALITSVPSSQNSYTVTKTSFDNITLLYDTSYNFKIISVGTNYAKSIDVSLNPLVQTGMPKPPNNFIPSVSCNSITLSWTPWSTNCIASYNVYCRDPTRNYVSLQNIPNSNSSTLYYTFTDLSYNTTYDFSINSVSTNNIISSYVSSTAKTPVPNNPPTSVTASISSIYIPGIQVSWVPSSNDCYVTAWNINYFYPGEPDISYNLDVPYNQFSVDISNNIKYNTTDTIYIIKVRSISTGYSPSDFTSKELELPKPYTTTQTNVTELQDVNSSSGYSVLLFNANNSTTIKFNYNFIINLLIIGGGSGGSSGEGAGKVFGGGGGGGGGIVNRQLQVNPSNTYNIKTGTGGTGGSFVSGNVKPGTPGTNSSFISTDVSYSATGSQIYTNNQIIYGLSGYGLNYNTVIPNSNGGSGGKGCEGNNQNYTNGSNSDDVSFNIINLYTIYCGGGGGGGGYFISTGGGYAGVGIGGQGGGYITSTSSGNGQNALNTATPYYFGGGGGGGVTNGGSGGNGGNGTVILWWSNQQTNT